MSSAPIAPPVREPEPGARWTACFAALVVLNVAALGAGVWSIWHGVSFVDEGYFVADVQNPSTSVSLWAHFLHAILGWTEPGLVTLRIVNVAGGGAVSLWFAVRAAAWLEAEGLIEAAAKRSVAAFVLLGSHLRFATFPLTVSYNSVLQATLLSALVLLLDARGARLRGDAPGSARPAVTGALVAVAGFVKAPTVLLFGPMILAAWIWLVAVDRRSALRHTAWMVVGGASACAVIFVAFISPAEWLDVIVRVVPQFAKTDPEHALPRLAARFAGEIPESAITIAIHYRWVLVPALAAFVGLALLRRRARAGPADATARGGREARAALLAVGVIAALFVARVVHMGHHGAPVRGVVQPYAALLMIGAASAVGFSRRTSGADADGGGGVAQHGGLLALLLLLLATPLAGLFGSNRHWMTYWPLYATPWFVVLAATAFRSSRALHLPRLAPATLLLVGSLAVSQSVIGVLGVLAAPMGMHEPRWRQTETLAGFGALDGVRVDPGTHAYLSALRSAVPAADPATSSASIGLFAVEAEQLALGRRAWGGAWTLFYLSKPDEVVAAMRLLPTEPPRDAIVLVHDCGSTDGAARVLRGVGLPFPASYDLRATLEHPWTRLPVHVYVPRR